MLKYEPIINNISYGNSKSLISRNLTLHAKAIDTTNITNISTNTSVQSSGVFATSEITDLSVATINSITNSVNPLILFQGNTAFSAIKADYQFNNFSIYPILFTRNILINNLKLNLNTEELTIKDNVILINNNLINATVAGNTTDKLISGIIFPIADQNIDTGYYGGLLYLPNSKIEQLNASSTYNWTNNKFNYFTNLNKGFFKLKYLPQNLNFSIYDNTINNTYTDLVNNNDNLSNLLVGSLGIADGELIAFNNQFLDFKIADDLNEPYSIFGIQKNQLNIYNDVDIYFDNKLSIKNTDTYITFSEDTITFYKNLILNSDIFTITFNTNLLIASNNINFIEFDAINNKITVIEPIEINNLVILNSILLNNSLNISNNFNIISNDITYINFNSINLTINLLQPTNINELIIINRLTMDTDSLFVFNNNIYFQDSNNELYFLLNSTNKLINLLLPTIANTFSITNNFNILNNIPITVSDNFIVKNNISIFINFNSTLNTFYNNLYFDKSQSEIIFRNDDKLSIHNNKIFLNLNNNIIIQGPDNILNNSTLQMINVNSSLQISNSPSVIIINSISNIFSAYDTTYITSGITDISSNIVFRFNNISKNTLMSGKLTGTTKSFNTKLISIYDISLWINLDINDEYYCEFNTLVPINSNTIGDWSITNIIVENTNNNINLLVYCSGSLNDIVVWGFKLNILSI